MSHIRRDKHGARGDPVTSGPKNGLTTEIRRNQPSYRHYQSRLLWAREHGQSSRAIPPATCLEPQPSSPHTSNRPPRKGPTFGFIPGSNQFDRAAFNDALGPIDTIFIVYIHPWKRRHDTEVHFTFTFCVHIQKLLGSYCRLKYRATPRYQLVYMHIDFSTRLEPNPNCWEIP
jgi:hypothetical protein